MSRIVNTISGRLSLRPPQRQSLEILERVCEVADPNKDTDLATALEIIKSEYPSVTDFEREFPSLCFALATGVGKTRLMGAFIAYLYITLRRRTLLVRGVTVDPAALHVALGSPVPRGWGAALPKHVAPGHKLVSETNRVSKRWRLARAPSESCYSVVGHGAALAIYQPGPDGTGEHVHRCTPEEHATLSGFPGLALKSPRTRERQTLVGNGWPATFGRWVAHAWHHRSAP